MGSWESGRGGVTNSSVDMIGGWTSEPAPRACDGVCQKDEGCVREARNVNSSARSRISFAVSHACNVADARARRWRLVVSQLNAQHPSAKPPERLPVLCVRWCSCSDSDADESAAL